MGIRKFENSKKKCFFRKLEIPEEIRLYEFAEKINKQPSDVIKELFLLGMMVTKNDFLDKDTIEILAETFEVEVTTVDEQEEFDYVKAYEDSVHIYIYINTNIQICNY